MFDRYLQAWKLSVDGDPIVTPGSHLLPVRWQGIPAMLKIAHTSEEQLGGRLMSWWEGDGAARVFAHDDTAVLMERATGLGSLMRMALNGQDDEASLIACVTVARLHAPRLSPAPQGLLCLEDWFQSLWTAAGREGGVLLDCAAMARTLLAAQQDIVVLHGDVHHENILDFGPRGWLAIDPKRVMGERGYDYANLICNPDLPTCNDPVRFNRQVGVIAQAAGLSRPRLLQWVLAHAGLSAAWFLEDGERQRADVDLEVARLAQQALAQWAVL
ncbi:aminoglycoside phosphotransferase family protein [Pseudomonas costantinii]|uniref:3'-kinase n=1 Tax=Pseudomonas costantinii TaxID=168469 RepID=A0A1S2UG42_9PSED|nr:aminoglycoside phosphotransferase family protein [Pseudomonas costantinii]NVZ18562.1 3'-kinase [Pseudomonas costantinii]OIN45392.1 3'-kinase [Pseudomonas costantinii]SED39678.1 streptomycin 6-kinase [Pseudomonas costantinii]